MSKMNILLKILFLLLFFYLSSNAFEDTIQQNKNKVMKDIPKSIMEVQEKYSDSIMAIPGVQGIGIGEKNKKECIIIFVSKITKDMKKKIPKELEGFPVKIEISGEFHAHPKK
jgi:hypothetical protein